MAKNGFVAMILFCALLFPSAAHPFPPIPARIGGTLTVMNTIQVTSEPDNRSVRSIVASGSDYSFYVTREDGFTTFDPPAQDTDGLNLSDNYVIDIPIYDAAEQPLGAEPGEVAIIHVFRDGYELTVVTPPYGRFIVGNSGSSTPMDLIVQSPDNQETLYTGPQLEQAIIEAVNDWDVGSDGIMGLPEAIRALKVVSGVIDF